MCVRTIAESTNMEKVLTNANVTKRAEKRSIDLRKLPAEEKEIEIRSRTAMKLISSFDVPR